MCPPTAPRRTATAATLLVLAAGALLPGASAALAAAPLPAAGPQAAHHYACETTAAGDEPGSLLGEGCVRKPGGPSAAGVPIEGRGGLDNWLCARVEETGPSTLTGHDCHPAQRWPGTAP
ncbi:hypothetical protein SALCHL_003370 [Streptomyces albus subsp. chlorinus]|uniref:hypothetical protein n=1 Tax=Streptomyces albus TaxID=1888 RepID=UPI003D0C91FF